MKPSSFMDEVQGVLSPWLPGIIHDISKPVQFESIAVPERAFSLNTVRLSRTFEKTRLRT